MLCLLLLLPIFFVLPIAMAACEIGYYHPYEPRPHYYVIAQQAPAATPAVPEKAR